MTETLKNLRSQPVNTAAIVITLGLALAAVTIIFSVVHGVLLRPLPFADQDRLMLLWQRAPGVGVEEDWFSPAQYFDIKEQVPAFESVAMFGGRSLTLLDAKGVPRRIGALEARSSFFEVLGVAPVTGRVFESEDDLNGADPKVLLGHRFFVDQYGSDAEVIGQTMTINGQSLEIVGVLPAGVLDAELFPTLSTLPSFEVAISMPMDDPQKTTRGSENYNILAKIAESTGPQQLETELLAAAGELTKDPLALGAGLAAGSEFSIAAVSLLDHVVGGIRTPLKVLLGATILLLLVACANVANLLHTRWSSRRHELAVRVALGGTRVRLIREALRESLVLTLLGTVLGLGLTLWGLTVVRALAPPQLPRLEGVSVSAEVMLFVIAIGLATLLLAGLGPALKVTADFGASGSLRSSAVGVRARSSWLGDGSGWLVIAQVALSLMLTFGAGLLLDTFRYLRAVDHGFVAENALSFRLSLVGDRYQQRSERIRFFDRLWPRLEDSSGIERAGGTSLLPLTSGLAWTDFVVEGFNAKGEENRVVADVMTVTPGYFDALGIRLIAGRQFDQRDWPTAAEVDSAVPANSETEPAQVAPFSARVVLVNRAFAEQFWPLEEAVGKWLRTDFTEQSVIVGVVDTVKQYGADADTRLAAFFPHSTLPGRTLFGVVRTAGPVHVEADTVRQVIAELDPSLPVYDVATMTSLVEDSLAASQAVMLLLLVFAASGIGLAAVGLYGVLSATVARHRRDIGVRAALGARRADLYRLVLRGAGTLLLVGSALGSLGLIVVARVLEGVTRVDAATLVIYPVSLLVLGAIALVASIPPARRAARIDPARVLVAD